LAFRLATGENVAAETFMLPELDYQEQVQRELVTQNPDWLAALGDDHAESLPAADFEPLPTAAGTLDDDWLLEEPTPPPPAKKVTDALNNLLPDTPAPGYVKGNTDPLEGLPPEVLANIERLRGVAADQTHAAPLSKEEVVKSFTAKPVKPSAEDWLNETTSEPSTERVSTGLTGNLTGMLGVKLPAEAAPIEEDDSWLKDLEDFDPFAEASASAEERIPTGLTGMLGDLDEAAVEEFDDQALMTDFELEAGPPLSAAAPSARVSTGLTGELGADSDELDLAALNWLGGDELPAQPKAEAMPASDAADSLGWLQGMDIEFDPNADDNQFLTSLDQESDFELQSGSAVQWMQTGGIELEDHADLAELDTGRIGEPADQDSLAWLKEAGVTVADEATPPRYTRDTQPVGTPEPAPVDETPAWITDDTLLDEMLELEQLTDPQAAFDFSESSDFADATDTEDSVDWQSTMPETPPSRQPDPESDDADFEGLDWLTASDAEPLPVAATDDSLAWLNDPELNAADLDAAAELPSSDNLAWLQAAELGDNELADAELAEANDLGWLQDEELDDAMLAEAEQPEANDLGWLQDEELDDATLAEAEQPEANDLGWLNQPEFSDTGLMSAELVDENALGWLPDAELNDAPAEPEPDYFPVEPVLGEVVAEEPSLAWMEAEFDETDEDPAADWISELDTLDEPAAADLVATTEPEFAAEEGFDWGEAAAEPVAADADWLNALGEPAAAETPTADEFEWGGQIESVNVEEGFAWEEALDSAGEDNLDFVSEADLDELTPEELELLNEEGDLLADVTLSADDDEFDFEAGGQALDGDEFDFEAGGQALDADEFDFEAGGQALDADEFDFTDEDALTEADGTPAAPWLSAMPLDAASEEDEFAEEFPVEESDLEDEFASAAEFDSEELYEQDLDWMVEAEADDGEWDSDAAEFDEFAVETPTAGMTGLLNNIEASRYTPEASSAESDEAALATPPDWLSSVDLDAPEDGAEPAWLQDSGELPMAQPAAAIDWDPADLEAPLPAEDFAEPADEFDWSAETDADYTTDEELIADEPNWLGDIQAASGEATDTEGDWAAAEDEPAWASAIPPLAAVGAVALASGAADEQPLASDEFEDEHVMTPAENAPDWLNAMVPGLEIDYTATEEDPEKVTPSVAKQRRAEFAWLNELVEQETAGIPVSAPPPPPPASQPLVALPPSLPEVLPAARRFIFTRLPAWMRPPAASNTAEIATTAAVAATAVGAATVPPYLLDDDAAPLPNVDDEFNADMPDDEFDDFDVEFDDDFNDQELK
jgi:hypothetical protein